MLHKLTFIALGTTFFFSFEASANYGKGWKPMHEDHKDHINNLHQARKANKAELRRVGAMAPKAVKATPDTFELSSACVTLDQGQLGSCVLNSFVGSVQALQTLDLYKKAGGTIASLQPTVKAKAASEEAPSPREKEVTPDHASKHHHSLSDIIKKVEEGVEKEVEKGLDVIHHHPHKKPEVTPTPAPVVIHPAIQTHTAPDINAIKATVPLYSRLFAYYDARAMQGDSADDTGTDAGTAFLSYSRGWADEKTYPYVDVETKYKDEPSNQAYINASQNAGKLKVNVSLIPVDNSAISKIESVISSGKIIMLAMSLYDSFESDTVAKTGIVPVPQSGEAQLGGHEMKIVGYNRTKQMMLVSNSWGTSWGLNGFCWVPYSMIANPTYTEELMQIKLASDK